MEFNFWIIYVQTSVKTTYFATVKKGQSVDISISIPTHYASMKTIPFVYSILKNITLPIRGLLRLWMISG